MRLVPFNRSHRRAHGSVLRRKEVVSPSWTCGAVLVLAVAMLPASAPALDCTPDDITLGSQAEVDDFQTDHGPCDVVVGTLTITGFDIADLDGLAGLHIVAWTNITGNSNLTDIGGLSSVFAFNGPLFIENNTILANLDGLDGLTSLPVGALFLRNNPLLDDLTGIDGLTSIGASLVVENNDSLENLDSLAALDSVASNINILNNDGLTSISGLSNLSGFTASLAIRHNPSLASLVGLEGLSGIGGLLLEDNDLLNDVDPLAGLTSVGNEGSALFIHGNAMLADLDGLAALISLDADLEITDNPMLGECSALIPLVDQVDDGLPGPGPGAASIPDINGDVLLGGNLDGCNSVTAILTRIFADGFESGDTTAWSTTQP